MKSKIFKRTTLFALVKIVLISAIIIFGMLVLFRASSSIKTESLEIKSVASVIQADGAVTPQNQAILHFQAGGKLTYLPFKEGDKVYQGQTIASLDVYILQKQLQLMANNYEIAKNSTDQTLQYQQAGVLEGQQRYTLDTTSKQGYSAVPETDVIYDNVKRIVDNSLLSQNSAQINVDIANYTITLASIISPINGIVTHMDVTTPYVNVTSSTSFTVADPASLVFRANVSENDIDFISIGNTATIKLGNGKSILGTVSKIYPDKVTLSTGQKAYSVDIETTKAGELSVMGQSGTALIQSNSQANVKLVPTWTVLNHDSVWVLADGAPLLRNVTVGKTHGNMTEILDGLGSNDNVIVNPESIAAKKYRIL